MTLDELLEGTEEQVVEWLQGRDLLHECNCGYTVYDEDAVPQAVQEEFGDARSDEINEWAWNLANRYGWLWLDESSRPKYRIYHCQHCAESEFALLMDLEKIAEGADDDDEVERPVVQMPPGEPCVVFIDESYSEQFPRIPGGSMSLAAFIVPESAVQEVQRGVESIIENCYSSGSKPDELKYSKISKHAGLLERVGRAVADLINSIPGSAVAAIYVPRSGLFGERRRSLHAIGHYEGSAPTAEELAAVESPEAVEKAVRETVNLLAHTLITCVGNYLAAQNVTGRIFLDPRNKRLDEPLLKALDELLPKTPVNAPLIPHQDAVVSVPPHPDMERLGERLKVEVTGDSHETHGLQIADFVAGDVRTFFEDVPELLSEATNDEPLVNKRVLFPQYFRRSTLSRDTLKKTAMPGKSALPLYRSHLAANKISCYAINGQMRNIDLSDGSIFDIMD